MEIPHPQPFSFWEKGAAARNFSIEKILFKRNFEYSFLDKTHIVKKDLFDRKILSNGSLLPKGEGVGMRYNFFITFGKKTKMLLELHTQNPSARKVQMVADSLEKGGVIIYPTDSVYGLGCDIFNQKAVARICQIRRIDPVKANLTFICKDIQQLSKYVHQIDNQLFRLLKDNVPGAFTFILKANKEVPRHFKNKRKTIGVRVPNSPIALAILEALGRPILSISLKSDDEEEDFIIDPSLIHDDFQKRVDIVIDGGMGSDEPSTIVDCTTDDFEILREGKGVLK